jgi:stage II sporulation protein M
MFFSAMFRHFAVMKFPMGLSTILFAAGIWIGAEWTVFHTFLHSQLDSLRDVAERLHTMENGQFWTGVFIFLNNSIKAILVMYLGLFFGIIPVIFLMINGMVIGYLLVTVQEQGLDVGMIVIKGLLPHGILEIPAILLACAYGLKLGGSLLSALAARPGGWDALKHVLRVTLPLMLFLTIVLFIAAVIESTLTVWLLGN